jgi:hypothetical protein
MKYPASLQPTTTETLEFESGLSVLVPKATPMFSKWRGALIKDTYGKKTVLEFDGRPGFAELIILWTLQKEGWQGVWVDRSVYRTGYWNSSSQRALPRKPSSIPAEIWNLPETPSGVWDVFCWRRDRVVFAESKKSKKDKMRPSQLLFAESALKVGLPLDSLLIVDWKTD